MLINHNQQMDTVIGYILPIISILYHTISTSLMDGRVNSLFRCSLHEMPSGIRVDTKCLGKRIPVNICKHLPAVSGNGRRGFFPGNGAIIGRYLANPTASSIPHGNNKINPPHWISKRTKKMRKVPEFFRALSVWRKDIVYGASKKYH